MSDPQTYNAALADSVFKLLTTDELLSVMMNKNMNTNKKLELLTLTVTGLKETCQISTTNFTEI